LVFSTCRPVSVRVIVRDQTCRVPLRAAMPWTVMLSPGCTDSRVQPLFCSSMGLASSTAQFTRSLPVFTLMKTCTCGFDQSTMVTMPVRVVAFVSSNFAEIAWCARLETPASTKRARAAVTSPLAPSFIRMSS
jgi:hypothetical protein